MQPAIRFILASSSAPEFEGFERSVEHVDGLLADAGVVAGDKVLVDNAEEPSPVALPDGWRYEHRPQCYTEFDAWSAVMADQYDDLRPVLATGALMLRGFLGGAQALRAAVSDPRGSGPINRAVYPHFIDGVWQRSYVSTALLIPPADWPHTRSLGRYTFEDLDPTFNPQRPFGPAARVPRPLLHWIWWWTTWWGSEYHRRQRPRHDNLDFLYRKAVSLADEAVVGLMFLQADGEPMAQPERTIDLPKYWLAPVTRSTLLVSADHARWLAAARNPMALCRAHLVYRSSRRLARIGLDRIGR